MEDGTKNTILGFSENHPYFLLAAVCILLVILVVMLLRNSGMIGCKKEKTKSRKKRSDTEEDLDELIESIQEQQSN
jgi:uncharacterized protein YlxW (UPF0749 family)